MFTIRVGKYPYVVSVTDTATGGRECKAFPRYIWEDDDFSSFAKFPVCAWTVTAEEIAAHQDDIYEYLKAVALKTLIKEVDNN